ncbi:MAG: NTP transferase domain-containing protein [Vicinamibacterales bacterium]
MQQSTPVTQTIILAAGSGSRLATARGNVPKPLMTVAGVPLVAHALEHARVSGCLDALVVIGFDGDRVRAAIEAMRSPLRIRFIENPDYTAPNGVSLLTAASAAASMFYLQMVDHLFLEPALSRLAATPLLPDEAGRVLVDSAPSPDIDLDDATKVRVRGTRVTAIGKGLDAWDAVDAGCFVLTHAVFDALRDVPAGEALTVSSGMRRLVADGRLGSVDIRGAEWIDVDTPADRDIAERLLGTRQLASGRL